MMHIERLVDHKFKINVYLFCFSMAVFGHFLHMWFGCSDKTKSIPSGINNK